MICFEVLTDMLFEFTVFERQGSITMAMFIPLTLISEYQATLFQQVLLYDRPVYETSKLSISSNGIEGQIRKLSRECVGAKP